MVNTENSPRVFKHFETMSFMSPQKTIYCHLPQSRGIIKETIELISKCCRTNSFQPTIKQTIINCSISILAHHLGIFRIKHHSYLPEDCNNMKLEVGCYFYVSIYLSYLILSIYIYISIYLYLYISIYIYIYYIYEIHDEICKNQNITIF